MINIGKIKIVKVRGKTAPLKEKHRLVPYFNFEGRKFF
jgi:hypothetical protein